MELTPKSVQQMHTICSLDIYGMSLVELLQLPDNGPFFIRYWWDENRQTENYHKLIQVYKSIPQLLPHLSYFAKPHTQYFLYKAEENEPLEIIDTLVDTNDERLKKIAAIKRNLESKQHCFFYIGDLEGHAGLLMNFDQPTLHKFIKLTSEIRLTKVNYPS